MVEVGHPVLLLKGTFVGPLILERVRRVDQQLESRVTALHHAEDAASIVIIWKDFGHHFIDEVGDKVKPKLEDFLLIALETLLTDFFGH